MSESESPAVFSLVTGHDEMEQVRVSPRKRGRAKKDMTKSSVTMDNAFHVLCQALVCHYTEMDNPSELSAVESAYTEYKEGRKETAWRHVLQILAEVENLKLDL